MNYLEEQTDGEAMINCIKNDDQTLHHVTQVSIVRTSSTEQPPLKDKSMWSDKEKKIQKIDCHARSLLIQGLPNDIYSLIDSNKTTKELWDALARHVLGFENGKQDRKATVLNEYETFKATEGELLLDTYIRYLQNKNLMDINIDALYNFLKQNQGDVNDAIGLKKKTVVVTSDPLALIAEKTKMSKRKEKVVVSLDSEGSDADDLSELNKITALLTKAFNRRKFYSKPTNNNLRTSSASQSANKKQYYVNEKIKLSDDYFQDIINQDFDKIDSPFQQTSSLKPYVSNVILEKIIIDLEDEVVSLLDKEKENLKIIESLKSQDVEKGVESSERVISKIENKRENDCQVIEKVCDSEENPNVIAPEMFKLSVSQSVSPISMTKTYCASNSIENLDTLSSVRRPKPSGVMWMRKVSSNTVKADLSSVNHSNLNKNNALCNARMNAFVDVNNLFVFDDVSIIKSHVSTMPFRKKPSASLNVPSRIKLNKSLPRIMHKWLPKLQPLAEPIAKWIPKVTRCSKHMTGNRALFTNFMEKFLGTVCFGNNDFAMIADYGDVVIGSMMIKKVYYVEGL
uniref:Integrase, catalytic region, zinc finger, CCHC-type, peptidase aspartic, catalytic n=1 Tax=Tanacetum cinerariifolium TaxID=118510 RepID=A0A699IEK9_TANCI|nr:integrase, catalytic region, zinc finger, CCHC-type, peptidase aspartic, catalytic [Tanacetum cinerariifolium]